MQNNENEQQELENNVDASFLGLGTTATWIFFLIFIIAGITLLPYLLNLVM